MGIDGLIILEPNGRSVIQTNFTSKSLGPAYPLTHIDAFNEALAQAPNGVLDPVIYVNGHRGPSALCHLEKGGLRLLCPVSGDTEPSFVFAFLQTFVDILEEYLGEISIATLKDHFDVVYQLLEEMLDDGQPLTTEPNALRDIVTPPSIFDKLFSSAGANPFSKGHSVAPFSSPIPWRKVGVKHSNNEIYFDIVENMRAIVNKSATVLTSEVWGKIETNSRLSGLPDVMLTFAGNQADTLQDCSFHPCIRLQRWTREKKLSFVPPDGRFTLMEYRFVPANSSVASPRHIPVPFSFAPTVTLSESGGTFDFTLTSKLSAKMIERLVVELYLGEGATGANCMVSSGATWGFDPRKLTLQWELTKVPQGSTHTLRGSFSSSSKNPRPARAFRIIFDVHQQTYSNLKVDKLQVTGEHYKPYKGLRGSSSGDIEWRW